MKFTNHDYAFVAELFTIETMYVKKQINDIKNKNNWAIENQPNTKTKKQ